MNKITHLFSALSVEGDTPPAEIHLLPAGTFTGADRRGPYKAGDLDAIIAASMHAGKLPLDENHATDLAAPRGEPAPARGWIVGLHAREDGIWGKVEWTRSGAQLMADKAYRSISPAIETDKDKNVLRILRASLVNSPNLPLASLHSKEQNMDLAKELRTALGLADDADTVVILNSVQALTKKTSLHAAVAAAAGLDLDKSLTDESKAEKIVEAVKSLHARAKAATSEKSELITKMQTLETSLHQIQQQAKRAAAEKAVDEAIAAGKPVKQLRDHYIERHMADAKAVDSEFAALPSLHSGGIGSTAKSTDTSALNATELSRKAELHAKQHGMSHAEAVLALSGKA